MNALLIALALVAGGAAGGTLAWALATRRRMGEIQRLAEERARARASEEQVRSLQNSVADRDQEIHRLNQSLTEQVERAATLEATLEAERRGLAEERERVRQDQAHLREAFQALSHEALQKNAEAFLTLARQTLETFQEGARGDLQQRQEKFDHSAQDIATRLKEMDDRLVAFDRVRGQAEGALRQTLEDLRQRGDTLGRETARLVEALKNPAIRGRWGEIQLRRVVELAGMLSHCDFLEQKSGAGEAGRLRPDLVVRLPGDRQIVVDAKAPVHPYVEAHEAASEEDRRRKLAELARSIRSHMATLSSRAYMDQFKSSPDFVLLFLPGEHFFSAALQQDPSLIEAGVDKNVIIATPTTLIALLRAIAVGWRERELTENALRIGELGRELHGRIAKLGELAGGLGKKLGGAVDAYNSLIASLETRVLVTARKFKDLGLSGPALTGIEVIEPLDQAPRPPQADELRSPASIRDDPNDEDDE